MVVIARDGEQQQAAVNALELVGVAADVAEGDRVEDGHFVGEVVRVVLVAKEGADVAGDELVVDLTFEEHVPDQFAEADAGPAVSKVDVGKRVAAVVTAGRNRRKRRGGLGRRGGNGRGRRCRSGGSGRLLREGDGGRKNYREKDSEGADSHGGIVPKWPFQV